MQKEILLALNFGKSPKTLQAAAQASGDIYKKIDKLRNSIAADQLDLDALVKSQSEIDVNLAKELAAWDGNPVTV